MLFMPFYQHGYWAGCLSLNIKFVQTHLPAKVAFPASGGTAGLETGPGKAGAVLSNKTVSLISRKCGFIWM